MSSKRPVNLDLRTTRLPVTAYTSIFHRIPGIILFLGIAMLLFTLDKSPSLGEGLEQVKACLTGPLARLVVWGLLSMLLYHLVAGIHHLVTDVGVGETLEGGRRSSKIAIVIAAVPTVPVGVWVW